MAIIQRWPLYRGGLYTEVAFLIDNLLFSIHWNLDAWPSYTVGFASGMTYRPLRGVPLLVVRVCTASTTVRLLIINWRLQGTKRTLPWVCTCSPKVPPCHMPLGSMATAAAPIQWEESGPSRWTCGETHDLIVGHIIIQNGLLRSTLTRLRENTNKYLEVTTSR